VDEHLAAGRALENKADWEGALAEYQKALQDQPSDLARQIAVFRTRSLAAQSHLKRGLQLRTQHKLDDAAREFERALRIDPTLGRAGQELRDTIDAMQSADQSTGVKRLEAQQSADLDRLQPPALLHPLGSGVLDLKLVNQSPKVLFESIGKVAGINVLFDPEFQAGRNVTLDLNHATLTQSLDSGLTDEDILEGRLRKYDICNE
jgi:general secretion pathway protein D